MHSLASEQTSLIRYGGWRPVHSKIYEAFFNDILRRAKLIDNRAHEPAVLAFQTAINTNAEMADLFDQMLVQVWPRVNRVSSFNELLYVLDILTMAAPRLYITRDEHDNEIGEPIGAPMYVMFDLLSNTSAGYDLFRKPAFNDAMKKLLDDWGVYLQSPASNNTLHNGPDGWFGEFGLKSLEDLGRGKFNETYMCPNEHAVNRGYISWDAFFTRKFQLNARPVEPRDLTLIYSACESTVIRIQRNIKEHDQFWLKGQNYSVYDMLGQREDHVSRPFIGGTVYQAFLSPQDYHRWHSPVNGTIYQICHVKGTYFAALPDDGVDNDIDLEVSDARGALCRSQPWLTHSATRAIIYIDADNEDIGRIAFISVGMAEVSTCEVTVEEGQHVEAGAELGMFHFGGSSYALMFENNVNLQFFDDIQVGEHILINRPITRVV
ncbi:phosphatidylserine decarboxylase [Rhodocollybia butyracea]|uniref:Phosphatidylserine decarboxylase n=1 Tax=Rhodocollybia butyracea TaxID=206335 RepID=A0A9P5U6X7_9AGAR|nr:phosphatidylserine decarboxylase [Rhodocollybia butyracea]